MTGYSSLSVGYNYDLCVYLFAFYELRHFIQEYYNFSDYFCSLRDECVDMVWPVGPWISGLGESGCPSVGRAVERSVGPSVGRAGRRVVGWLSGLLAELVASSVMGGWFSGELCLGLCVCVC